MSANNQTLIKEHEGKWYVFTNVMAESWCYYDRATGKFDESRKNELSLKFADGIYSSRDEAFEAARELEMKDDLGGTEYGVQFNRLCKDDAEVTLII